MALSTLAIAGAYGSAFLPGGAPGWAAWLFMVGTSVLMVATMALGAARNGRIGPLWLPFGLVLLILLGGFGAALVLPPASPDDPTLWLGLPPRAAVILYGIGLLPFLLVPVAYAWTFDHLTLAPGDLERIRDEALRARDGAPGAFATEPGRDDGSPGGKAGSPGKIDGPNEDAGEAGDHAGEPRRDDGSPGGTAGSFGNGGSPGEADSPDGGATEP